MEIVATEGPVFVRAVLIAVGLGQFFLSPKYVFDHCHLFRLILLLSLLLLFFLSIDLERAVLRVPVVLESRVARREREN